MIDFSGNSAQQRVNAVMDLLNRSEKMEYFGESVSQLAHSLQCAQLAVNAEADYETIIAALLHDIGHICPAESAEKMGDLGVVRHEKVGADYLRKLGFSEKTAQLVEGHVKAKRYLTWKSSNYRANISKASLQTLALQGGPMSAQEAEEFERDPHFREKLRLRTWDEKAKEVGAPTLALEDYRDLLTEQLLAKRR